MMINPARTTTDEIAYPPEEVQDYSRFRQHFNDPQEKWQIKVMSALVQLVNMPEGWDSYRAPAVKRDAAIFAFEILYYVMGPRSPVPHVVPSSVGGVQLEWHEKDIDLEIHVVGPFNGEVWFHDNRTGETLSAEISNDFSLLEAPILALTDR